MVEKMEETLEAPDKSLLSVTPQETGSMSSSFYTCPPSPTVLKCEMVDCTLTAEQEYVMVYDDTQQSESMDDFDQSHLETELERRLSRPKVAVLNSNSESPVKSK